MNGVKSSDSRRLLVVEAGADKAARTPFGTALEIAHKEGNLDVVALLREYGSVLPHDFELITGDELSDMFH